MSYRLHAHTTDPGWVTATGGGLPWPVAMRVALDQLGRVVITGLRVEPHAEETRWHGRPIELTLSALRTMPLGKIKAQIEREAQEGLLRLMQLQTFEPRDKRRARGLGRDHYERVARLVQETPDRPAIDTLRQAYPNTSDYTRYRWLRQASLMGLLDREDRP
jgi:hypothetical protein